MTTAKSPGENVEQFFKNYGDQIRGTGNNASAFINGLQGRDASGKRVEGWKKYNSFNPDWEDFVNRGIRRMRREIPTYLSERRARPMP
ncbi:MAG: hypothetical protein WAL95_01795 [Candidatus Acidiferrales bacterium]